MVLNLSNQSKDPDAGPFYTTASFPWREKSIRTLWEGRLLDENGDQSAWKDMIEKWEGTILVGGNGRLFVFPKYTTSKPFSIRLLDASISQIQCMNEGCLWMFFR